MSENSNQLSKNKFSSSRASKQKIKKSKRKESSRQWISRQLNDPYVSEAQKRGFRSRAAFKLLQIDERYSLFKSGMTILDLGCAPGGWLQVMSQIIHKRKMGKIIGIDLLETDALPDVDILVGDITDKDIINKMHSLLGDRQVNGVLSDMAADTTGHRPTDHIRTTLLLEEALNIAIENLSEDGFFLGKCFKGGAETEVLKRINTHFKIVKHVKPDASRKESIETYVLGMGFKKT